MKSSGTLLGVQHHKRCFFGWKSPVSNIEIATLVARVVFCSRFNRGPKKFSLCLNSKSMRERKGRVRGAKHSSEKGPPCHDRGPHPGCQVGVGKTSIFEDFVFLWNLSNFQMLTALSKTKIGIIKWLCILWIWPEKYFSAPKSQIYLPFIY